MVELIMIVLSFTAVQRWKAAGVEGVAPYIWGAWGSMLGCVILGAVITSNSGSVAGMMFFAVLGYGVGIAILVSAMRTGKQLLQRAEQQRTETMEKEAEAEKLKQREMTDKMAELQRQLDEMKSVAAKNQ